jgi:light-regulated signal transduction histidine kinase (bacteriophytochrome)
VLINDLLAFSRVGRTTEHFEDVDLAACLSAALGNLYAAVEESGARIEAGALPTIRGDSGLLIMLWQNLVGNAIKFRTSEAPVVTIDAAAEPDHWLCRVADNGIGIEARFADRIFVIFQRLHGRDDYVGTGIGLALCKKVVEFHGGRIWLDVDFHPGTRMCFTLPTREWSEPA